MDKVILDSPAVHAGVRVAEKIRNAEARVVRAEVKLSTIKGLCENANDKNALTVIAHILGVLK